MGAVHSARPSEVGHLAYRRSTGGTCVRNDKPPGTSALVSSCLPFSPRPSPIIAPATLFRTELRSAILPSDTNIDPSER